MKQHLHNSDEVFISPQQGWEQMQLLLDKNLPVKNNRSARKFYFFHLAAASFITIFLFGSLVLNNTAFINSFKRDQVNAGANTPDVDKTNVPQGSKAISYSQDAADKKTLSQNVTKKQWTSAVVLSTDYNNLVLEKIAPPGIIEEITDPMASKLPEENGIAKMAMIAIQKDVSKNDSTGLLENDKAIKRHPKRSWNLSAGLAMNAMIGQQQNFRPYPAAVLRYNVSNNFFVSLGLSAGSHVSGDSRGVKKTVYVNDVVNNIQFYNTVDQYHDFTYADMPLLAGVNINKNISLQAGIQASVLLNKKSKTIIEEYDFQMRFAGAGSSGIVIGAAAPVSEIDFRVDTRKMDYRFTSGIKYTFNKLALNLMYQRSLQPALTGDITSGNKHQLVTLSMQFKIK